MRWQLHFQLLKRGMCSFVFGFDLGLDGIGAKPLHKLSPQYSRRGSQIVTKTAITDGL